MRREVHVTRALRGDHDDVDVGRRNNARTVAVSDGETVREIECLAGCEVLLDDRPASYLGGIRQENLDDGRTLAGLFDAEEGLTRYPSVCHCLVVSLAGTLADDDIETIVTQVERLAGALYAVTDDGDGLVLQYLTRLVQGKLFTGYNVLGNPSKIHLCHFTEMF